MIKKYIFNLNLPAEMEKPIKMLAEKRHLSITKFIIQLIENEIKKEEKGNE